MSIFVEFCTATPPLKHICIDEDKRLSDRIPQLKSIGHRKIVDSDEVLEHSVVDRKKKHTLVNQYKTKTFLNIASYSVVHQPDIRLFNDKNTPFISGSWFLSDGKFIPCDNRNMNIKLLDKDIEINPYKPRVPFVGYRQTVQTQIRRRRRLIRVFTVCLQEFLFEIE